MGCPPSPKRTVFGDFLGSGALNAEVLLPNSFLELLSKVVQGIKYQGGRWPSRTPIVLENVRLKDWAVTSFKAVTMCLWSRAWHEGGVATVLQPAIVLLEAGPIYVGSCPCGQPLPYAHPRSRSYDHSLSAWVLWQLRDGAPGGFTRPFGFFGELM